jgi:hypothetical protein
MALRAIGKTRAVQANRPTWTAQTATTGTILGVYIVFHIRFLPVNQAWVILFGQAVSTASIVAWCDSKAHAEKTLKDWRK